MTEKNKLDAAHLDRIARILEGLPADCDLPHALLALEDAYFAVYAGLTAGLDSVQTVAKLHAQTAAEILHGPPR